MLKRRHTRWLYKATYSNGRLLVGRLYNQRPKCDIIRARWEKDKEPVFDFHLRPDEAVDLSAGLGYLVALEMYGQKARQQKAARKAARTRRKPIT